MTTTFSSVGHLSDRDLLAHVERAAQSERHAMAQLIALLMELDARRLYLSEGYSSLFTYCTQVLHLSEHAAYGRIEAARAARRYPVILELLAEGALTLTTIGLLGPHLNDENHVEVLESARHKSKREIECLVARLHPRPDVPSVVRKLPTPKLSPVGAEKLTVEERAIGTGSAPIVIPTVTTTPRPHAEIKPLGPERYKIQFTVSRETYEQLRQAQDLLRHVIPNGDPAAIFERAIGLLIKQLSKSKLAAAKQPSTRSRPVVQTHERESRKSRHIPSAVRREVWTRDGGRCAFKGDQGRCSETGFLEFHHVVPFAAGGNTAADNLELRCRAHNAYEAERYFGFRHTPVVREIRGEWVDGHYVAGLIKTSDYPSRSGPS